MSLFPSPGGAPVRDPKGTLTLLEPPSSGVSQGVTTTPFNLGRSCPNVIEAGVGAGTVVLPAAASSINKTIWIRNTSGGNLAVTGAAGAVLANNTTGIYACDGTTWRKLAAVSNA